MGYALRAAVAQISCVGAHRECTGAMARLGANYVDPLGLLKSATDTVSPAKWRCRVAAKREPRCNERRRRWPAHIGNPKQGAHGAAQGVNVTSNR